MDHNYAIENHTAERYLLHELPEDERDAYEDHFFSCPACAEEIKSASEFMETARQMVRAEMDSLLYPAVRRRTWIWGSWLNWRSIMQPIPAMACLLFVSVSIFSIYQNRVSIPQLKQMAFAPMEGVTAAQVREAETFPLSDSRAQIATFVVSRNHLFNLQVDIPPADVSSYRAYIVTDSGVRKLSFAISKKEANNPVPLVVPAGALESGSYNVVVQGINTNGALGETKGEQLKLSFQLKIQD